MGMDQQQNFDSYFSQAMTTPTLMASGPMTPSTTDAAPTTIKMEDVHPFDSPSPALSSTLDMSQASSTPAAESKSVKKRKSWGQVLPEPKTQLPPRKRAKTEDEKEQRRIERVKRNRLAAHNSRERKRQEYEVLQLEKDQMEADLKSYKKKMAQMKAELNYYRQKFPGETPDTVFDLSTITNTSSSSSSAPSSNNTNTICPAHTFPSPMSMDSMESPRDSSCQPETPASVDVTTPEYDSTQYPAAILCDLQCRSYSAKTVTSPWAATMSYLTLFNLTLQWTKSLLSQTTFSTLASSPKDILQLLSNPLSAWLTLMLISLTRPSSGSAPTQPLLAFLTASMQSSQTCRVPPAQLMLATRLSQLSSSVDAVDERSTKGTSMAGPVDDGSRLRRTESSGRSRRVSPLKREFGHEMISSRIWENMGPGTAQAQLAF